jgi:branched-chain amino acid transport system substrate-binding protein
MSFDHLFDPDLLLNRSNVRDAIQTTNLKTLQGVISFDENGDIRDRTVSLFQYKHNAVLPDDDHHQLTYIGVAPQS